MQTVVFAVLVLAAMAAAAVIDRSQDDDNDELLASASGYGHGGHSSGHYGGPGYISKYPVGDIYGLGGHHGGYGYGGHGDGGHGYGGGHKSYHHGPPVVYIPGRGYHGCTGYPWYLLRKYNIPGAEGEYSKSGPGCHDYHHYGGHHDNHHDSY